VHQSRTPENRLFILLRVPNTKNTKVLPFCVFKTLAGFGFQSTKVLLLFRELV
jgi:hypothetical protein